jgi:hypothetical protein
MDEEAFFYQTKMNDLIAEIRTGLEFGLSDIETLLETFDENKINSLIECIDFAKKDAESLRTQYKSYKMKFCPCCQKKKG